MSKNSTNFIQCVVCGDEGSGFHYGVSSCFACRTFFKRHAEQFHKISACRYNRNCQIDVKNRHICRCCRLRKCFANGMKIDHFRCSRSNVQRKENLFKLIDQSFNDRIGFDLIEDFVRNQNSLPTKYRYRSNSLIRLIKSICLHVENSFEEKCSYSNLFYCFYLESHCQSFMKNPMIENTLTTLLGPTALNYFESIRRSFPKDPLLFKMILNLFIFNQSNQHVEIIWNYLHSLSDVERAILSFSTLMRSLVLIRSFLQVLREKNELCCSVM